MECLWRLFGHRQQDGDCHQQDPAVFYLYFLPDHGLSHYHLPGAGFLEEYAEVYVGRQTQPLVLPVSEW